MLSQEGNIIRSSAKYFAVILIVTTLIIVSGFYTQIIALHELIQTMLIVFTTVFVTMLLDTLRGRFQEDEPE